ncbi:uncharacterized protein LOC135816144 isoform X2 [Sycon ciliatum]|uniref:uncharacterized protein LOC135816144 isoform X2 n=1 Tax=Sycon ciliatum TaxID=27933 RepID=UPI0031F63A62
MAGVPLQGMDTSYGANEAPVPSVSVTRGDIPVEAVLHDLAGILRDSGELVLNNKRNLSLTPSVVRYLNGRFRQLAATPAGGSSGSRDAADVEFLWQFLQKVPSVKIMGNMHRPNIQRVSLHVFHNLTHLTLRKVNIGNINGLQALRSQLQSLTCERSLRSLKSALVRCGADEAAPFTWPKLVHLDASYNGLSELDDSLRFTSGLVSVNLSHNQIAVTQDFFYPLNDVVMLNLAFNQLNRIPTLCSRAARVHLRTLILRGNNLDNLQGLQHLRILQDLDLSDNCLLTHYSLSPLGELANLVTLTLAGNPLSFQSNHRMLTCAQLSPHINCSAFVLDAKKLNVPEAQTIPRLGTYGLGMPPSTPEISSVSRGASPLSHPSPSSDTASNRVEPLVALSSRPPKRGRRSRTRAAAIEDSPSESVDKVAVATSPRHLKFESSLKLSQYQLLKEQMGPEYLQQLDLPNNSKARDRSSSAESGSTMPASTDGSLQNLSSLPYSSTPVDPSDRFDSLAIPDASPVKSVSATGEIPFTRHESDLSDMENEDDGNSFLVTVQESDDEGDELKQQRFVSVTDKGFLQERDYKAECVEMLALTCLLHASLRPTTPAAPTSALHTDEGATSEAVAAAAVAAAAVSGGNDQYTLHLEFDYSRRDRRQRDYILDSHEHGQAMLATLLPIVESNRAAAAVCPMLECLTCSAVFRDTSGSSHGNSPAVAGVAGQGGAEQRCPTCSSAMLVSVEVKPASRDPLQPYHIEQALSSGRSSANHLTRDVTTPTLTSVQHQRSLDESSVGSLEAGTGGRESEREDPLVASFNTVAASPSTTRAGPHLEARRSLMSSSMLMDPEPRPGYSPKPLMEVESECSSRYMSGTDDVDAGMTPVTPIAEKMGTSGLQWKSDDLQSLTVNGSAGLSRQQPVATTTTIASSTETGSVTSNTTTPTQTSPMSPPSPTTGSGSIAGGIAGGGAEGSFTKFLSRYSVQESGAKPIINNHDSDGVVPPGGVWQEQCLPTGTSTLDESLRSNWIAGATTTTNTAAAAAAAAASSLPRDSPDTGSSSLAGSEQSYYSSSVSQQHQQLDELSRQPSKASPDTTDSLRVLDRQSTISSSPTLCYSLDDCTYLSHDLQLHLQLEFFSNDESCACILRAPTLDVDSTELVDKFLVVSSTHWYLCDLSPNQRICPDSWPACSRKLPLSDVCFVEVGLGCQTLRVEFDSPNAYFTFLVGDEHRCLDFVHHFTGAVLKHISCCRHAYRGIFYSNYLTLHHLRLEILKSNAVDFDHVAYDIVSRHCLRQSVSLVPVDSSGGVLTACIPGQHLVDMLLELKLEGDRRSAVHMCQNLLRDGLLFVEGGSSPSAVFLDKPTPCYGFSSQTQSMKQWPTSKWMVDSVIASYFIQSGGERTLVDVLVVDKTVYLARRNYNMPAPRLPRNDTSTGTATATGAATGADGKFFSALVSSQLIENMSSLILYDGSPHYLGIDFFAEDVDDNDADNSSSGWQFECCSPASVKALCSALTAVWEKEFHVSLQTDTRPGNPPART